MSHSQHKHNDQLNVVKNELAAYGAGVAYGVYEVAENLGKAIGNPLVGYLKDHNGSYTVDELIFAGMGLAAAGVRCEPFTS